MIRWPEQIKGKRISSEIISLEDCLPTLLAAAGDSKIKENLLKGRQVGDTNFKVHIDGYNFLPYLKGEVESGPRDSFFAFVDDGITWCHVLQSLQIPFFHPNQRWHRNIPRITKTGLSVTCM